MRVLCIMCMLALVIMAAVAFAHMFKIYPISSFAFSVVFGVLFSTWAGHVIFNK